MSTEKHLIEAAVTQDLFGPEALAEPAELEVPDKYRLLDCLGHGGFGVVYKAMDTDLDRVVALKFLTDCREADAERFRREARFTARINDPAIVQIYEFGYAGTRPFIAMQFIDGPNLSEAELPTEQVVRVMRDAAAALHKAHTAGVVHRDFKPANILLDREQRAYLTDFGIARDLSTDREATLSLDGQVIGTPALMPPEQARGACHAIDARSDIYSIGASLFVLLCGRYPFDRANAIDVLHAVIHEEPPMPRSIQPTLPRPIEAIILKCMHKDRRMRYQSAARLVRDLDDFLGGNEIQDERTVWFRKMVGAEAPLPQSEPDLFETLGVQVLGEIAAWDAELYRVSRNIGRLYPKLDTVVERLDRVLDDHPHYAWARFYRGMALRRRGCLDRALEDMERTIDRLGSRANAQFEMGQLYLMLYLREQRLAYKHITRSGTRMHLSESRSRLHQAVVAFEEARRMKYELPEWQMEYARAVSQLAAGAAGDCVLICDAILEDDPDIGEVWRLRGDALRLDGQAPFESYDEALRVRRSDYQACMSKAEAHFERQQIPQAKAALEKALEIYPEYVEAQAQLARAIQLQAQSESDPARKRQSIEEALGLARSARDLDDHNYDAAVILAELLLANLEISGQAALLEESLSVLKAAEQLPGCQNRVKYLTSRARLLNARRRIAAGADPRAELQAVLDSGREATRHVPNSTWARLMDEAREQLDQLGGPPSP